MLFFIFFNLSFLHYTENCNEFTNRRTDWLQQLPTYTYVPANMQNFNSFHTPTPQWLPSLCWLNGAWNYRSTFFFKKMHFLLCLIIFQRQGVVANWSWGWSYLLYLSNPSETWERPFPQQIPAPSSSHAKDRGIIFAQVYVWASVVVHMKLNYHANSISRVI